MPDFVFQVCSEDCLGQWNNWPFCA